MDDQKFKNLLAQIDEVARKIESEPRGKSYVIVRNEEMKQLIISQMTLHERLRMIYEAQQTNSVIGLPRDLVEEVLQLTEKDERSRSWDGPQNQ